MGMCKTPDTNIDAARLRPKFSVELPVAADEAMTRLREGLEAPEHPGSSMAAGRHAELLVDRSQRKVWSPRLTVRLEDAPSGSTLRCRFSPRPDVWTGFMFLYFVMVFLVVFGATLGYVQQVSDEPAWGYWGIPVGLSIIALIHLASYVGQRLAADQMRELRGRLEQVLVEQFGVKPGRAEGES
jgi:hypothetical protein